MTEDLTALGATELAARLARREVSAVEALEAHLRRIGELNRTLNAIIHLDPERALRAARALDRRATVAGPLHGLPMTLKDAHRVAGMPTVVGDPGAPRLPARRDGHVAARLRAAGAVLIGKTNVPRDLEDFQTDNPVFGRTNHPLDPARTPGGSSGGAAAALAARMTTLEVGSDIAGSVRLPAAFTGVIGLKPSAGAISSAGHVTVPAAHPRGGGLGAIATVGPMARTFDDLRLLHAVLADRRPADRFTPGALRLGVLPALDGLRAARSVQHAIASVADAAASAGARVASVEAPMDPRAMHRAFVAMYEAARASGGAWRARHPAAAAGQRAALAAWAGLLERHDAILLPAVMCGAFTHRPTGTPIEVDGQPLPYWGLARYTEPFNLTGLPAIVFPAGTDASGTPIGVQLIAAVGRDRWLIDAAEWLAAALG